MSGPVQDGGRRGSKGQQAANWTLHLPYGSFSQLTKHTLGIPLEIVRRHDTIIDIIKNKR
tara:strand:+ start:300 stop:479 length:180 start_codon:yes stop_codon:yes gene_type:complete